MVSAFTNTELPWVRWIGEFFVIVLGVAIGFQVDRWYEQRQDNATAAQYIERLREDIDRDIESSRGGIGSATTRMESLRRVVQSIASDEIVRENATRYMFDLRQAFMRFLPVPSDSTYRELESTGNMALLPVEVRKALHDYYSRIRSYSQFLGGYENMQIEAYKRFAGILPPENFGILSGVLDPGDISYSIEESLSAAERLRNNQSAQEWLYQMGELKIQELRLSERSLAESQEILLLLNYL